MARIVLVHGAFGRAACWDRVAPGLRAAAHSVEAIDLPGQGDDLTPVEEVTLDRYAERVCDALAGGPPAVLVGHSMGGMVITQAAAGCDPVIEIDTDHAVWASRPDELAAALNRIAV